MECEEVITDFGDIYGLSRILLKYMLIKIEKEHIESDGDAK